MAYHMRDKAVDGLLQPPAEEDSESASLNPQELRERVLEYASERGREQCRQVREVTIVRKEKEPLGMAVTVSTVISCTMHECTVEPLCCGHLGDLVRCPV